MNLAKQPDKKSILRNQRHSLYTNNETSETEIRTKISFAIATRKMKYLGINLTKEVKDLFSQNYTAVKKVIKEDTR